MSDGPASAQAIPETEHALQFVGAGEIVHNTAKPVQRPGPTQLLLKMEACGICFSDTKLLHAWINHPRKSECSGLPADVLAEIPSYVPGTKPTVPGHEAVGRIVAVGADVRHHKLGERVLVQTDYRHLPTTMANAAFGYNFEGGLQEYVLLDERVIIEPETGERFLLPVGDGPSASAIALVEPWACVEASYAYRERNHLLAGGRLLVVADEGHSPEGLAELVAANKPASATILGDVADTGMAPDPAVSVARVASLDASAVASFDDIVYFGADAARIEQLQTLLAFRGVIDIVTSGAKIERPVAVDVGRVHYDLTRWVGTSGRSAAEGYAIVPASGELRDGDRVAVVGAAGPMGLMHVVRSISGGWKNLSVTGVDIDDTRLAHLERLAAPLARERAVELTIANSKATNVEPGFSYVALMVPAPALVAQALSLAGRYGRINVFAGFAIGTRAEVDLDRYVAEGCYFLGTSGSGIDDMKAVLAKVERGELDTNISLDMVTGFAGFKDAMAAVESRTSSGKIMVYPTLPDLGLTPLSALADRVPEVAAGLDHGRWTRAAEEALLRHAGRGAAEGEGQT